MIRKAGISLFFITLFLALLGIFILYETSSYTALLNIGDKYYFVKNQLMWLTGGILISAILWRFNYKKLYQLALPLLIINIVLLFLVFFPGIGLSLKGSHRWIDLGFFVFQPSEMLKITFTLYLAAWLSSSEKGRFLAFCLLFLFATALVALEPDMGTALVIAVTAVSVYFLSNAPIKELGLMFLILILGSVLLIKMEPYRIARLTAFQEVSPTNIQDMSYHTKQVLVALGSGGLTGVGLGNSIQKYGYVPESTTDSIFAIYAEEVGFLGSVFLILVLFAQLMMGFIIAAHAPDKFGKLLAAGIVIFLGAQMFLNIGSQVVVMPLTGVPLPFVSYGGSSMIINFAAIGILLNISKSKHT